MRSPPSPLTVLKRELRSLSLPNKRALLRWLQSQITKEEEQNANREMISSQVGREVIQEQRIGKTVYRQERIRCGKPGCKCMAGELHGPYWYSYCREGGKVRSQYIGKTLKTEGELQGSC
ncbi:MAG: hypothetical protein KME35_07710 [Aphanocapsa sp. GSE-SYN-MK-11-07L]|jgi:hypothetical protein|nr:hypothetical protein [Aphanocapsa sp. GSE-SYN-MK-11-07L]